MIFEEQLSISLLEKQGRVYKAKYEFVLRLAKNIELKENWKKNETITKGRQEATHATAQVFHELQTPCNICIAPHYALS